MTATNLLRVAPAAPLDAELLLAHVLGKDRAWLLAHGETTLTGEQKKHYDDLIERRKNHEPLAYILGEKEFYGRSFIVDRRVLIPRPSTETLIDEVKFLFEHQFKINAPRMIDADTDIVIVTYLFQERIKERPSIRPSIRSASRNSLGATQDDTIILDVGTGSGCIAITLAKEIPDVKIIATDISKAALDVSKANAKKHEVLSRIEFMEADGLSGVIPRYDRLGARRLDRSTRDDTPFLLVSNPPYIPENEKLPPDISLYEPRGALFAGDDGMDVLTPLIESAKNEPLCIGFVMEMQQEQAKKLMTTL